MAVLTRSISRCGISDTTDLLPLWELPGLPLTERFGRYSPERQLAFDQELLISVPTGHVQLGVQLDPAIMYSASEYTFRTGDSQSSRSGVDFFLGYFQKLTNNRVFESLVDIGGNDLFVARKLEKVARHRSVIDPICRAIDGHVIDGIRVFGRFVEAVNLASDVAQPDVVVCRHTLEHVAAPRELLTQWLSQCRPDCLYVVEVPSFENLLEAQRFDAVFHQHYHYYDLGSFRHLLWECGAEYIDHAYNYQGSCGGSLIIAFRKAARAIAPPVCDIRQRIRYITSCIERYRWQMEAMAGVLADLPKPVYGYGASLMLATLAYHLHDDLGRLECVLDDDPARDGTTYENLPVTVRHTAAAAPQANSSFLITSLENVRPIFCRIQDLQPRRVLVPLVS